MHRFRKARRRSVALVCAAAGLTTAPGMAGAQTEGLTQPASLETTDARKVRMDTRVVLQVKRNVLSGQIAEARGRVWPHLGARRITVTLDGRKVRTVRVGHQGRFRVRWRAPRSGVYRAVAIAHRTATATMDRSRAQRVNVFRPALASYYGPGLYGNSTACGRTLTPGIQGVANQALRCGAKVTLRHGKRTVTVPVIDRGPYAGNREFDLTAATKRRLGFPSTGTVLSSR